MLKWTKRGILAVTIVGVLGFVVLGTDFPGYVTSAFGSVKDCVKNNVPVELEIQRGRDLLKKLRPEIRDDVRQLARDEVEIERLQRDIERHEKSVDKERRRLTALRGRLDTQKVSYVIAGRTFSRDRMLTEVDRSRERLEDAGQILTSKRKDLDSRRGLLSSNSEQVRKKRHLREQLAAKIDALESEHARLKSHAEGTGTIIDDSTLSKVQSLIGELEERLEVTRKVLEHDAHFPEDIPIEDEVDEGKILERVDDYLAERSDSTRL
jgi:chromosome segregation ATPase